MAKQQVPVQERSVRRVLEQSIEPLIDMSDLAARHSQSELCKFRTARALAALCIAANAKLSIEDSCASVVDESGDEGIDAIAVSLTGREIYLVQSKTGSGAPSPTEVQKFIDGIKKVLENDWEGFGSKLRKRQDEFEDLLTGEARVVAIFTTLSTKEPTKKAREKSDRLVKNVNLNGDILEFRYEALRDNFEHRNAGSANSTIEATIRFEQWLSLGDFRSEIVGVVNGQQLADLAIENGDRLFDRNIRSILRGSATNDILYTSIRETPRDFWYFNNGITIVASDIGSDKRSPQPGAEKFILSNVSIVNGAQTVGSLARAKHDQLPLNEVFVTVRVVSTKDRDSDFEQQVTRYTNTQNQIGGKEFVALDPRHQMWKEELEGEGVLYMYKSGSESLSDGRFALEFSLDDATRALACYSGIEDAALVKRNIGAFYSDLEKGPYTRIFSSSRTAEEVCNAVRFRAEFERHYSEIIKSYSGKGKPVAKNANYFCCAVMMRSYRSEGHSFGDITKKPEEWVKGKRQEIEQVIQGCVVYFQDHDVDSQAAAFFKRKDVTELWDHLMKIPALKQALAGKR